MPDLRDSIQSALQALATAPLRVAATDLFRRLGYESSRTLPINTLAELKDSLDGGALLEENNAHISHWKSVHLLFQITESELVPSKKAPGFNFEIPIDFKKGGKVIKSYVFFALDLHPRDDGQPHSRETLGKITRALNRLVPQPVLVLFRHGGTISISIINRRLNRNDNIHDVLTRVSLTLIAKLRFFLTLVVEQRVHPDDRAHNYGLSSLPNLETNLICANTLADADHGMLTGPILSDQKNRLPRRLSSASQGLPSCPSCPLKHAGSSAKSNLIKPPRDKNSCHANSGLPQAFSPTSINSTLRLPIQVMNNQPDQNDVSTALGLLRDSLAEEEQRIRNEGAKAMQGGDYDTATSVIEFARRLLTFQKKVESLVGEWDELEDLRDAASPAVQEIVSKRFFGKKKNGEITPHTDFCPYILQVLVEMGGGGKTKAVLDWVGDLMKGVLKPQDYEYLKSGKKQIRWRNSAQWARSTMVNVYGRMVKNGKNGIWEISDKGRKWLKENEGSK